MNAIIKKIVRLPPLRIITLLVLKIGSFFTRLFGQLKLKSLVTAAHSSVVVHPSVEIKYGHNISIGKGTSVAQYACLGAKASITIGEFVRISRGAVIETAGLDLSKPPPYKHKAKPIVVEDGVWIATNAIILPGVRIGRNSIIGAGTVISKDIPPESIVVGQAFRKLTVN